MSGEMPRSDTPEGRRTIAERRYAALKRERESYVEHWKEIADYVLPRRGRFLINDHHNKGGKRNHKIIDNTATRAARTLAAGLMAGVTSPARPWFQLGTPDPAMMEFAPVKHWLAEVERLMREVFNRSNFYNAMHTLYLELGVFCTAPVLIDENARDVIRCHQLTVGSYAIGLSDIDEVNAFVREVPMTVDQVVRRFGPASVSSRVRNLYEHRNLDEWIDVIHVVQPNPRHDPNSRRAAALPWSSCYYELGSREMPDKALLFEGGYHEFPMPTARWDVRGGDVYGSGPGMDALGDVKQLQTQQLRKGQGIDKQVNPPLVAPTVLRGHPSTTLPGGVTYVDTPQQQNTMRPLYQVDPKLGELRLDMADVQMRIKETFYEDLFRAITSLDRRQITAREIEERHEEKLLQLGPVLERMHSELLDPIIDRTFAIMVRNRMLPPAPREIAGASLRVEYISVLAQAQRAVGIAAVERFTNFTMAVAGVKPDVVDKVDFDQAIDEYAQMAGVPPKLVVPDDVVEQRRKARAAMQAKEAQMAQAAAAADMTQRLGNTPAGEDTVLNQLTNPVA